METPKTKAAIAIQRGTRSWTERGKAAAAKKQVEAQAAAQALLKAQFAKPAPSSSLRKASSRKAVVAPPEEAATAKAGSSGTSRARRSGSSKSVVGSKSVVAFVAAPVDDAPAPPPPAKANQSALARARTASGAVYSSLPRAEAPSSQGGPFNSPPAPSATIGRAQSAASLLPARSSSSSSMNMSSTVRAPTAETETRGGMEAMLSRGGAASGGYTGPKFDDALGVVHDTPAQGDEEASKRAEAWLKTEQTRQVSFHMKHGEVGYDAESSKRKASASASSSVKKNPFNFGPGANAKTNNNPRRRAPRSKTEQVLLEAEAAQNFAVMEEKKPRSKTFQAIDIIMCRSCPTGSSLIPVGPWV